MKLCHACLVAYITFASPKRSISHAWPRKAMIKIAHCPPKKQWGALIENLINGNLFSERWWRWKCMRIFSFFFSMNGNWVLSVNRSINAFHFFCSCKVQEGQRRYSYTGVSLIFRYLVSWMRYRKMEFFCTVSFSKYQTMKESTNKSLMHLDKTKREIFWQWLDSQKSLAQYD